MSALSGQTAKVLRIDDATLHAVPIEGGSFELHVVTRDGTQVVIAPGLAQLVRGATELLNVSDGNPMSAHAAGIRMAQRQAEIKPKTATPETQQK